MKLSANELRLGNNIYSNELDLNKGEIVKIVVDVNRYNLFEIEGGNTLNRFEPIPLTEEWLLKFGFYQDKTKKRSLAWCLDERHSPWPYKVYFYEETIIKLGRDYYAYAQYVHQLQNLYFAITGEELQLSEKT